LDTKKRHLTGKRCTERLYRKQHTRILNNLQHKSRRRRDLERKIKKMKILTPEYAIGLICEIKRQKKNILFLRKAGNRMPFYSVLGSGRL
jgi:hypothetical protein